jgi:hypothetical protein
MAIAEVRCPACNGLLFRSINFHMQGMMFILCPRKECRVPLEITRSGIFVVDRPDPKVYNAPIGYQNGIQGVSKPEEAEK